jgi:hypothetical protein
MPPIHLDFHLLGFECKRIRLARHHLQEHAQTLYPGLPEKLHPDSHLSNLAGYLISRSVGRDKSRAKLSLELSRLLACSSLILKCQFWPDYSNQPRDPVADYGTTLNESN